MIYESIYYTYEIVIYIYNEYQYYYYHYIIIIVLLFVGYKKYKLHLILNKALNYEHINEYSLTLTVGTAPNNVTSKINIIVKVIDRNDNTPSFKFPVY